MESKVEQSITDGITKFEVITSITDVKKFSQIVFDILRDKNTAEEIESFLSEKFPKDGLRELESIAQSDYPLSFAGRQ